MIPAFVHHGGRLTAAVRSYGGEPGDWLDLSTGLNPIPWTVGNASATNWTALPDPNALIALEVEAARHFGSDPALTCAVPGSETALRLIAAMLDRPGRSLAPAYRTHAEAFAKSCPIAFAERPQDGEVVVLANPNNPDGLLRTPADIRNWHTRIARVGGWLIVDEAFADCQPEASVVADVRPGSRLIVLRSFGKFFGLAGLRLGFVIAPPSLAARLRLLLGSWPVHSAALTIGRAAYADSAWTERTRAELPLRVSALDAVLASHGFEPQGACPLFRYLTGCDAQALFARLAAARILTRPFDERPDALRLGVPAATEALDRLDRALRHG